MVETTKLPEEFLRGIELFNQGRFFECHEVWETIWLKSEGEWREFLHAMIQAAAAFHHAQRGNLKGAMSLARKAICKFEKLPQVVRNFDSDDFCLAIERFLAEPAGSFPHISDPDKNS